MATLICGSLAFDTIMGFEGRFANQILPDQLHILNVSFMVPTLRRDFGGCAGNIAYAVRQLGGTPLPMATVGRDGDSYLERLQELGIDTRFVRELPDTYTAQAMIMTDLDNNQITAFHPGAMMQAHVNQVPMDADIRLGIVAPDGRDAMLQHAERFHAAGIPFVFDPGQGLPMFDGNELAHFVELASVVTVNDYEGRMLCDRMGINLDELSHRVQGLVVTLGAEGCDLWEHGQKTHVARCPGQRSCRPDGLRRRLARRAALWARTGLAAAALRRVGQPHGRSQGGLTRTTELPGRRQCAAVLTPSRRDIDTHTLQPGH